jgi:hypothetical protein
VPARRLTRFEYERTMHDLLGIDVPLADLLPADPVADGFDTVSSAQQVSHFLLEKYLSAADVALDAAFDRAWQPDRTASVEIGWAQFQKFRARSREPGPRPKQRDAVAWSSKMPFNGRMPPTAAPASGWYRITLRVAAVNLPANGLVWCSVRSGACKASAPLLSWIGSFAATKDEREHTFEAWIEAGHLLEVRPTDATMKPFNNREAWDTVEAERSGMRGVAIKSVKLERIHHGLDPAAMRERLFAGVKTEADPAQLPATFTKKKSPTFATGTLVSANPGADVARLVQSFAARAFRRPVTEAEAEPYVTLAQAELKGGASLADALRGAYRGVLSSPRFLYLEEPVGRLPDHALATRLSYFLWSSMPDEELRALADAGKLSDARTLHAQVERMLGSPKSARFIENFLGQWLNLTEIDFTVPDAKLYPEFDEVLKFAMLDETHAFFRELLDRDLSVSHVVHSDFGMVNERLARHYGIAWPGGEGIQRVAFRPENQRGGLITHGSVLKVTANGTTTSPVIRGVWMLERIMGRPVPPPPANVPAIEPDIRGAKTIREQLDKHRHVESCAVCHVKIDPPGFALESYDVIGGWRDHYRAVKETKGWQPGLAVDPSFTMADGRPFADLAGFKQLLLADPDQLARNLAAKFVTYATGAGISFADRTELDAIVQRAKARNLGVRTLLMEVIQSPLFTHK